MGPFPRASRRAAIGVVAIVLMLALAAPAGAASIAQLHRARDQLRALTEQIRTQQAALARSETRLEQLRTEIERVVERLAEVHRRTRELRVEVAALQVRLAKLVRRLNELANTSYVSQPGGQLGMILGVFLGSSSIRELSDGMEYASRLAGTTATVASDVLATRTRLAARLTTLRTLGTEKTQLLATLSDQRQRVGALTQQRRHDLERLTRTQERMIGIVRRLRVDLAVKLFPLVGTAFQGGAHTSYGRWAALFLLALDAPTCHSNEVVLVAWQLAEFTQAAWNPLATTKPMTGSWSFNSSGVQNYPSLETGLLANKLTLYNGWSSYRYGAIVTSLRSCASPFTTARAIQASSWCHGCANGGYVVNKVGLVAANFDLYSAF